MFFSLFFFLDVCVWIEYILLKLIWEIDSKLFRQKITYQRISRFSTIL